MKKKNKETIMLIAVLVVACIIVVGTWLIKNDDHSTGTKPTETESVTETESTTATDSTEEDSSESSSGGIVIETEDPDGGNWTPIK